MSTTPTLKTYATPHRRKAKANQAPVRQSKTAPRKQKRGRKQNPDAGLSEVLDQFEQVHGRAARQVREKDEVFQVRTDFAKLGRLLDMQVWIDEVTPISISPRGVDVVSSGDGGSLYFKGGDQEIPLEPLGLAEYLPKDHVRIGDVETIAYHTAKGFHDFEPRDYTHEFGEEGGELPALNYDTVNKLLYLSGGSYKVRPEGIVN